MTDPVLADFHQAVLAELYAMYARLLGHTAATAGTSRPQAGRVARHLVRQHGWSDAFAIVQRLFARDRPSAAPPLPEGVVSVQVLLAVLRDMGAEAEGRAGTGALQSADALTLDTARDLAARYGIAIAAELMEAILEMQGPAGAETASRRDAAAKAGA